MGLREWRLVVVPVSATPSANDLTIETDQRSLLSALPKHGAPRKRRAYLDNCTSHSLCLRVSEMCLKIMYAASSLGCEFYEVGWQARLFSLNRR